ncbi:Putative fibronectin domain-containing lipoprotein [hydrothermal vent metagenome]|uniref:Fibronectin domain-containing lipoprotein n=1 Tax=hydrothermal vent metagenome TaxID=652676 RepID=A0A3B1E2C4_9ZZZZ
MISEMSSVALEWKPVETTKNIYGYYVYRSNFIKDGQKLKRVATLNNKYTSHYLDIDLVPDTQYLYAISVIGKNDTESKASQSIEVITKPRLKSVSFITAVSQLPRQVKLLWRPHQNKRVDKYIIERLSPKDSKFKRIKTIKHRLQVEYIDKNLLDNSQYTYRVQVLTFDKIKSFYSQVVKATTKDIPNNITNIHATTNLPKIIKLRWEKPNNINNLKSYVIYASNRENSNFSKVTILNNVNITEFTHKIDYDNKKKFYKITTVDKDDLESSKKISPILGKTLAPPAPPIITAGTIKNNEVFLEWSAGDERAITYNIHKTIKKSFISRTTKIINNITSSSFNDKKVTRGITYIYTLEAVDKFGLVSRKTNSVILTLPLQESSSATPTNK